MVNNNNKSSAVSSGFSNYDDNERDSHYNNNTIEQQEPFHLYNTPFQVGDKVDVYWSNFGRYYSGTLTNRTHEKAFIRYDDGDSEWLPLETAVVRPSLLKARVEILWQDDAKFHVGTVTKVHEVEDWHFVEYDDGESIAWVDFKESVYRIVSSPSTKGTKKKKKKKTSEDKKHLKKKKTVQKIATNDFPEPPVDEITSESPNNEQLVKEATTTHKPAVQDSRQAKETVETSTNNTIVEKTPQAKETLGEKIRATATPPPVEPQPLVNAKTPETPRSTDETSIQNPVAVSPHKAVLTNHKATNATPDVIQSKSPDYTMTPPKKRKRPPHATVPGKKKKKYDQQAVIEVGTRIGIWWEDDQQYYNGVISKVKGKQSLIHYDDGESEWLDLAKEKYVIPPQEESTDDNSTAAKVGDKPGSPTEILIECVDLEAIQPGTRVAVWWKEHARYFAATVMQLGMILNDQKTKLFQLRYDDITPHDEWRSLETERFRLLAVENDD